MIIVKNQNVKSALEALQKSPILALDTETTGLKPYQGDKLFSLIIADESEEYYFNFQTYPLEGQKGLYRAATFLELAPLFKDASKTWRIHNAKFDLAFLANEGAELAGTIHCTEAIGRVVRNDLFKYSLDALVKPLGFEKDKAVEEYIAEHKLFRFETYGDDEPEKIPDYSKVPFELITKYACLDARLCFILGGHQEETIAACEPPPRAAVKPLENVFRNELALTPVLFQMERQGILIDRDYVATALDREKKRAEEIKEEFAKLTGQEFVDSAKCFAPIFDELGVRYPLTPTGRPSFKAEFLEDMKAPVAKLIQSHRDSIKRANTYYANFLYFADKSDRIHLNLRQGGTGPGRMSAANPNLQNLTKRKDKGAEFPVRRSFIPSPGFFFGFLDFDQAEYRLMLERCKQMDLIELVKGGLDVHTATAQLMGVDRESAKTINFMLLYGGGIAKLCMALFNPNLPLETLKAIGRIHIYQMSAYKDIELHRLLLAAITPEELQYNLGELHKAHALLEKYFSNLPRVKDYTREIQKVAKARGYIVNWFGRRCYYKAGSSTHMAANHDIQGGIADVVKIAMVKIKPLLEGKKSRMLLQIHDELLFEFHDTEEQLFYDAREIMERAYPHKFLPITCGADYSRKSWADKLPFVNGTQATGNSI